MEFDTLLSGDGRRIAYRRSAGTGAGIVFLGGLRSDMTGTKAAFLEGWAKAHHRPFLRFDYTGHGASSGRFNDGCIGDWLRDAQDTIFALTEGPQVLVGSSMGAWIGLLLGRQVAEKVAGFVGISSAPDFTEVSMWRGMTEPQRAQLLSEGHIAVPSEYSDAPYLITRRLIEDGRRRRVLAEPLRLPFAVRLLHGTLDTVVPTEIAARLFEHAESPDIQLLIVKGSDHRFSTDRDLSLISRAVADVSPG